MAKNCYGDLLDFFHPKENEPLTGTYYEHKPFTPDDEGKRFSYDIVDDKSVAYNTILNTMQTNLKTQTIRTNDACGFTVNGYCVTQDGGLWQISSVIERVISSDSKQALRHQTRTFDTEFIVRLIGVNNPWGFK